jgi:hypothetical protein
MLRKVFTREKKVRKKPKIEIMEDMKREDATFNLVGEKAIKCALEIGLVGEEGVGRIGGVPFVLVLL